MENINYVNAVMTEINDLTDCIYESLVDSDYKELNHQIKWSSDFEVGDSQIDKQHLDLFTHSIKLLNAIEEEREVFTID